MQRSIKYLVIGITFLTVVFFILLATSNETFENSITVLDDVDSSPVYGKQDGVAIIQEEGWSIPIKLQANDKGREDSTYITRDGRYVLFYYDPTIGEFQESTEGIKADPKIFFTKRPFVTKQLYPIPSDDINAETGPYISKSGDLYYTKTFIVLDPVPHVSMPQKTVKNNDEIIDMGTGKNENNPYYCDAMDELYVDIDDQDIVLFKNGKTTFLPEPINIPGERNFQPFLDDDCQTMYFTSTRDSEKQIFPFQIYKSYRLGEFDWSKPELFISFPIIDDVLGGVGEFSMTRDGKQIVFIQLTITNGSIGQNDMYYSEKR